MLRVLLGALLFSVFALNQVVGKLLTLPFPSPHEMNLAAEDAVTNASLLTLGMRRLAADIIFIRTIVYYGTKEEEMSNAYRQRLERLKAEMGHDEDHDEHDGHSHAHGVRGIYPDLAGRGLRMLLMDPYWTYPVLYIAGALAFNQDRPHEAVDLLRKARAFMPREKRYLAYTAAIAFHKKGNLQEVVDELTPLLQEEDSPTMIKNMVAFMNIKLGNEREAARLYLEILESRDLKYHEGARKALAKLGISGQ